MAPHPYPKRHEILPESSQLRYELAIFLSWFGEYLRQCRTHAGLQQKELAEELGITQPHLSQIENGSRDFRISTLLRIAAVFENEPGNWVPTKQELSHAAYGIGGYAVKRSGPGILKD